MFGSAELMLGANHIKIRCFDGVTRTGRIKGKIKKKVWIREGDVLVVVPWSFQDEKCDIIYRYTRPPGGMAQEEPVPLIFLHPASLPGEQPGSGRRSAVSGSKKFRCRGS